MRWTVGLLAGAITIVATAAVTIVWNDAAGSVVLSVGMWATLFLLLLAFGRGRNSSTLAARDERQRFVAAVEEMDNDELNRAIVALDARERELLIADEHVAAFAVQRDKFVCLSVLRNRGVRYPF